MRGNMKTKFIMVASSKGGVGKSTAALGIAHAFCDMGHKVLIADLDFGNACLDMLLGVQDRVICTVQDVAKGSASCEGAVLKIEEKAGKKKKKIISRGGELWLLPSAPGGVGCIAAFGGEDSHFSDRLIGRAVKESADFIGADVVIIDTGAGINRAVDAAAKIADTALIVTGQMPVALRSADATAGRLSEKGVKDIRLIINSFDAKGVVGGGRCGLLSAIDTSRAPLAGVVPYDYSLMLSHEGIVSCGEDSKRAFSNIAERLCEKNVPLFSGIKSLRKIKNKVCL